MLQVLLLTAALCSKCPCVISSDGPIVNGFCAHWIWCCSFKTKQKSSVQKPQQPCIIDNSLAVLWSPIISFHCKLRDGIQHWPQLKHEFNILMFMHFQRFSRIPKSCYRQWHRGSICLELSCFTFLCFDYNKLSFTCLVLKHRHTGSLQMCHLYQRS